MTDALSPGPPPTGPAALRIAVVGPTLPHPGAAAAHTTTLAHLLTDAGHDVTLVSWANPRPAWRPRRASAATPEDVPAVLPFARTVRALSWARPDTWVRVGRHLREVDAVVVVHVARADAPAHLALLRAARALPVVDAPSVPGRRDGAHPGARARSVVVCHEVLPAEHHVGDARLVGALLSRVDAVIVHAAEEEPTAHRLGARRVRVVELPPHLRAGEPSGPLSRPGPTRLLALGRVHEPEGVDVLLRAMRAAPDVTLTVAGELTSATRGTIAHRAADPALAGRVEVRDGHVPADELAALLAEHDVLVLPHRSATTSQDVALGHAHGLPVLAVGVAPFSHLVHDGVDGLLVPPDDEPALAAALRRLGDPELRRRLAEGVQAPDLSGPWAHYLGTLEALSVDTDQHPGADDEDEDEGDGVGDGVGEDAGPGRGGGSRPARVRAAATHAVARTVARPVAGATGRARRAAARAVTSRRRLVTLRRSDLPEWVLATDVLGEPDEADDARRLARILGLPRSLDSVSAWAALGALAVILRVRDDGRRSAVIVDEGGSRSLLSRWARAVGFAPVEIDFTGAQPSVAALDVDTGSLDVIVRIHPDGCDADDVDHVLEQASWALRSGGLLVVTVPIGPRAAEGALGPADVRGVLARAHDLGFVLVGDLDGDVNARMREAGSRARADDAAYGLVRLTLRRR
ncbi:glycosyltransferase family 4 protein [Terrabacter sp. NPDC000476]|uniref:glycosyltransferase family 4 protein n=1 Tax=Terrabacter sp. NPDC000476 TaxID=3154258 RepID=UPI003328B371